jgi:hypothetical protein
MGPVVQAIDRDDEIGRLRACSRARAPIATPTSAMASAGATLMASPTAAPHRTHTEIFHLVGLYDRLVGDLPPEGPAPEDLVDLRRVLYGLDAILRLHMAQEEELYLSLGDEAGEAADSAGVAA